MILSSALHISAEVRCKQAGILLRVQLLAGGHVGGGEAALPLHEQLCSGEAGPEHIGPGHLGWGYALPCGREVLWGLQEVDEGVLPFSFPECMHHDAVSVTVAWKGNEEAE